MPTLQLGDSGAEVSTLQDQLYQLGYELYGSGEFDAYTEAAVSKFQADCGLEATGVADDSTLDHVVQYCESPPADAAGQPSSEASGGSGQVQVVDDSGAVFATGTVKPVTMEGGLLGEFSEEIRMALEGPLLSNPLTAPAVFAIELANALGCTVGLGIDVDFAAQIEPLGLGFTGGAGLYFAPSNQWGLYGSFGADMGFVETAAASACVAAVLGGPGAFAGDFLALEASGGEGIGGGVALLFNPNTFQFVGFAGSAGVCGGIPVSVFASYTRTWIVAL